LEGELEVGREEWIKTSIPFDIETSEYNPKPKQGDLDSPILDSFNTFKYFYIIYASNRNLLKKLYIDPRIITYLLLRVLPTSPRDPTRILKPSNRIYLPLSLSKTL
jgi:hypothetical protein